MKLPSSWLPCTGRSYGAMTASERTQPVVPSSKTSRNQVPSGFSCCPIWMPVILAPMLLIGSLDVLGSPRTLTSEPELLVILVPNHGDGGVTSSPFCSPLWCRSDRRTYAESTGPIAIVTTAQPLLSTRTTCAPVSW